MNIENELIKLKNQMDSKIDGLLEIYKNNNKVESEPTERDGEYFDVNINLLNNNNIIKELIVYPTNFYIKNLNLIIEYDGEHHFQPVRFGGMSEEKAIENFIKTKENDEIKNQYCKDNGIDLLRISYTEKDNIESIIINKLNSIKSIN